MKIQDHLEAIADVAGAAITRDNTKAAQDICQSALLSLRGDARGRPARWQLITTTGVSIIADMPAPRYQGKSAARVATWRGHGVRRADGHVITPISSSTWRTMMAGFARVAAIQIAAPVEGLIG